jgi:hypothetical protein
LTSSALTFSAASTATIQPAASQALNITGHAASTLSTDSGNLTIQAGSGTVTLGTSTTLTNISGGLTLSSGGAGGLTLTSGSGTISTGSALASTNTIDINVSSTTALRVRNGATATLTVDTASNMLGIGATPTNSLLTVGTGTTTAAGGMTFGTDTSLYRSGAAQLTLEPVSLTHNTTVGLNIKNTNNGNSTISAVTFSSADATGFLFTAPSNYAIAAAWADRLTLYGDATASGINLVSGAAAGDLRVFTGGFAASNERLRVTGTGLVGINTLANPSTQLGLAGTGSANGITFGDGVANSVNLFRGGNDLLQTADALTIGSTLTVSSGGASITGNTAVTAGNISVAQTGAGAALILDRTDGVIASLKTGSAKGAFLFDSAGNFSIGYDTRANIAAGNTAGTDALTLLNSGNVGIGDSTPIATFVVGNGDLFQIAGASGTVTSAGGYIQSGTVANTLSGATTFSAAGTALSVTNTASIGTLIVTTGGADITGVTDITGAVTINTTGAAATTIGNGSGTFAINSTVFDVTTTGQMTFGLPGTTDTTIGVCKNLADTTGATTGVQLRDCSGIPSDIAEMYAGVPGLRPGDVVSLRWIGTHTEVSQSNTPQDNAVFGVVSTLPVGQFGKPLGDGAIPADRNPTAIGLAGRVPVKISAANGNISVGDPLTSSSTPGVAVKATGRGKIIGYALEPYTGDGSVSQGVRDQENERTNLVTRFNADPVDPTEPGVGKILVLAQAGYQDSTSQNIADFSNGIVTPSLVSTGALVINAGEISNVLIDSGNQAVIKIGTEQAAAIDIGHKGATTTVKGALVSDGPAGFNGPVTMSFSQAETKFKITNSGATQAISSAIEIVDEGVGYDKIITTPNFTIAGNGDIVGKGTFQLLDATNQQLVSFDQAGNASFKGNLNLASASLSGGLTIGGDLDIGGLSTFQKLATFLGKTVFRQDVTFDAHLIVAKDTAGYAKIKTGETEIKVKFKTPYENAPIVTAAVINGQFVSYTIDQVTKDEFIIKLQDPATTDLEFSWTALGANDPQTAVNLP